MITDNIKNNSKGIPVYLNIYNFWSGFNKGCGCIGLGVFHTAIQISFIQYMYYGFDGDESGVVQIQPKSAAYQFAEQILLGYMDYSYYDLQTQVLQPLRLQFLGSRYDLLNNNCNHFAYRFIEMLDLKQKFPRSKIFRITDFFNTMRCCIPNCILSGRLDWFTSIQQEQVQSNLNQRLSHRQYDKNYRKISRTSSKYHQFHQFLQEQADDIYVKQILQRSISQKNKSQLN